MVDNEDDLLTVFLSHTETFTDEYIIDELVSLYFASVATSGLASTTILSHFINDPVSLNKVRAELTQEIEDQIVETPELAKKSLIQKLDAVIDLKRVHNLEHLSMCF